LVFLFGSEILIFGVIFGVDFSPCGISFLFSASKDPPTRFVFAPSSDSARPVFGFHEASARVGVFCSLPKGAAGAISFVLGSHFPKGARVCCPASIPRRRWLCLRPVPRICAADSLSVSSDFRFSSAVRLFLLARLVGATIRASARPEATAPPWAFLSSCVRVLATGFSCRRAATPSSLFAGSVFTRKCAAARSSHSSSGSALWIFAAAASWCRFVWSLFFSHHSFAPPPLYYTLPDFRRTSAPI
jgi:hypothetical protein